MAKIGHNAWAIGHFGKYHNTLCLSPQIKIPKALFLFSLATIRVSSVQKTGSNAHVIFGFSKMAKIGHNAWAIAFAKCSVWVQN